MLLRKRGDKILEENFGDAVRKITGDNCINDFCNC